MATICQEPLMQPHARSRQAGQHMADQGPLPQPRQRYCRACPSRSTSHRAHHPTALHPLPALPRLRQPASLPLHWRPRAPSLCWRSRPRHRATQRTLCLAVRPNLQSSHPWPSLPPTPSPVAPVPHLASGQVQTPCLPSGTLPHMSRIAPSAPEQIQETLPRHPRPTPSGGCRRWHGHLFAGPPPSVRFDSAGPPFEEVSCVAQHATRLLM